MTTTTIHFGVILTTDGELLAGALGPEQPGYLGPLDESFFQALEEGSEWNGINPAGVASFTVSALDSLAEARAIARHVVARDSEMAFAWEIQDGVVLLSETFLKGDPIDRPDSWALEDLRTADRSLGDTLVTENGIAFTPGAARQAIFDASRTPSRTTPALEGVLEDWRGDEADSPVSPIAYGVTVSQQAVSLHLGGSLDDPYGPQASVVSVEREGDVTRVLLNDSLCDAPMIFEIRDGQPIEVKPSDWEPCSPDEGPGL